jgi:predicted nucleic acid-binding protein
VVRHGDAGSLEWRPRQDEKRKLEQLSAVVTHLETTVGDWALARRLAPHCRDQGKTIPTTDILVAACATYHAVELEHKDGHFELILPLAKAL